MQVNRVDVGDQTVLDLTGDTVTPENLLEGATAHNAAGERITGSAKIPTDYLTGGSQTVTSNADGGDNVFEFTKSDGTKATFTVKNGSKGAAGKDGTNGTNGTTPTIKAAAGANIAVVGTPSVTASTSGPTTTFTFNNLKGAKGDKGDTGATGATGPAGPGLLKVGTAAANASNCPSGAWYGQYS